MFSHHTLKKYNLINQTQLVNTLFESEDLSLPSRDDVENAFDTAEREAFDLSDYFWYATPLEYYQVLKDKGQVVLNWKGKLWWATLENENSILAAEVFNAIDKIK